jgi:hypothetical protein
MKHLSVSSVFLCDTSENKTTLSKKMSSFPSQDQQQILILVQHPPAGNTYCILFLALLTHGKLNKHNVLLKINVQSSE